MHSLTIRSSAALIGAILCSLNAQTETLPEVDVPAPYVATPYPVVDAMLTLAHVGPNDLLIDMGCDDGRIAIQAAKRYGAHAIRVDINPERIAEATENARRAGVERLVRFEEKNVYDTDVSGATVVAMYLYRACRSNCARPCKVNSDPVPASSLTPSIWAIGSPLGRAS